MRRFLTFIFVLLAARAQAALGVDSGTVTITTGAVNTTFDVSTLAFQPEVCFFTWSGRATDGTAEADVKAGIGVFTGTSSRRAFAMQIDHAAAVSAADQVWRNDAVIATHTTAGATDGLADVSAIDGDGFTLIIDDVFSAALQVAWLCLGGADLTDVQIVDFTLDTGTGTQDVTTSFALDTGKDDKLVVFLGGLDDAVNTNGTWGRLMIGAAAGDTISSAVTMITMVDGADPTQTFRYSLMDSLGESIAYSSVDNTVSARANVSAWLSTGFTVTRLENTMASGVVRVTAVVLKGGRYSIGDFLSSTGTSSTDEATPYQPKALMVASHLTTESSISTTAAGLEWSLGFAVSSSNRRSSGILSKDAVGTVDAAPSYDDTDMYRNLSTAATIAVEGLMDHVSFNAAPSFTWVMDDADPSANFVWYAVLADEPAAPGSGCGTTITTTGAGCK